MPVPVSLDSNEYYEHLRDFRDQAFVESYSNGRRRQIGKLSFGHVGAMWHSQEDGIAILHDEGLRWGSTTITPIYQTTLRLIESVGEGQCLTEFKMDLDDIGLVKCRLIPFVGDLSIRTWIQSELAQFQERKLGLDFPSDDKRELLYEEMQRGASGLYAYGG